MSLDLSGDWAVFDDPVTVSYYRQTAPGVYAASVSIGSVTRGQVTKADVDADPALSEISASVFHVWRAKVPDGAGGYGADLAAQIGDELVDATPGLTWTVRSHALCDWDGNGAFQRARLVCEARARDYRWAVAHKRPAAAQDAGGRPTYASYATVATTTGHLRTISYATAAATAGRLTAPTAHELTVRTALDWRATDVVEVTPPSGPAATYTIAGSVPATKFDLHQRLYLERLA